MPSPVKENYLKALFTLSDEEGKVNITDLSNHLGVTKPTANHMIKSLEVLGWVKHQRYQPVVITPSGKKAAALIIRKHRLTEMFLYKVMGFGWEEVHEVAEQMEHIDSPLLFDRMDELLDHPTIDPHGSSIPDRDGRMIERDLVPLSDMTIGVSGSLAALSRSSQELLHYLNESHISLGTDIRVIKVEPFDEMHVIKCEDRPELTVSKKLASCLLMRLK